MPCKQTLIALHVKAGDNLLLNCSCFNKNNGQWSGPNKTRASAVDHFISYTHGQELNPRLNRSKYVVFGGYEDKICYFMIRNFMSDDDGIYKCRYISSSTIYIYEYKITATSKYNLRIIEINTTLTQTIGNKFHRRFAY